VTTAHRDYLLLLTYLLTSQNTVCWV